MMMMMMMMMMTMIVFIILYDNSNLCFRSLLTFSGSKTFLFHCVLLVGGLPLRPDDSKDLVVSFFSGLD